jgi:mannose/fructose/N-acetylgalactosamine-specific phosphotransferase system component IIB
MDNLLFLIDSRGIHGKITAGWGFREQVKQIVFANDAAAASEWERAAYVSAAGSDYHTQVLTLTDTVRELPGLAAQCRTLLVVSSVADAHALLDAGIDHPHIIITNLDPTPERRPLCPGICISPAEQTDLSALLARGVRIEVRLLPQDRPVLLSTLLASP